MGAFFQELTPEINVTVDENSERHSMTTTYIHKLNLGVNMAYIYETCSYRARTDLEKFGFCPGKKCLLSWNCPGIL